MVFTGSRYTHRAVQAVQVEAPVTRGSDTTSDQGAVASTQQTRQYTFSFCLQQIEEGPAKGVWYTVGVRVGNYAN